MQDLPRTESISKEPKVSRFAKATARRRAYSALLVFALFALFIGYYFRPVVVDGPSMLPTLQSGEWLTVTDCYWLFGSLKPKDIVVFRLPHKPGYIIKRIYKMAGDKVDFVNSPNNWKLNQPEFTVPPSDIYVLGDNRAQSEDSRFFGPVKLSNVIGKVLVFH